MNFNCKNKLEDEIEKYIGVFIYNVMNSMKFSYEAEIM